MYIQFWGAARTVTGSMHLLEVNGHRILLDCGLFQGKRQEAFRRNRDFPFDVRSVDALVLSHAHIDHSGNIPSLVKQGYQGPIYATPATYDLCGAMLRDSAHIQASDAAYVNKKRARKGEPPVEPLYDLDDAVASLHHFVAVAYSRPVEIVPGVRLTFYDAGHILGSALTVLDADEDGRRTRILFTGDLGRKNLPILRDPQMVSGVDVLITESTYGNRDHGEPEEAEARLREIIQQTYRRGGKVIIPAFAVGRTQEVVYALHRLTEARALPPLPIYVDSPLATNVTEIFRLHPECYDEEITDFMWVDGHRDPFGFSRLTYVRDVEASKRLNVLREPAVIISASGMCEAGRILHHLKHNIGDARNTVLFVGFQGENTLGRYILDGHKRVKIFGERHTVRAHVESIDGYSAHADRGELLAYMARLVQHAGQLRQVFVVHGDDENAEALARALAEMPVGQVHVPHRGERFAV
ncbi:MAG: MBL fold metallo-hydrolase [Anaerolineae bacterium]|nr:MBL fold metallo-hydrolase [Anaerolineae bacterium]